MPAVEIYDRRTGQPAQPKDGYTTLAAYSREEDPGWFVLMVGDQEVRASVHYKQSGSADIAIHQAEAREVTKLYDATVRELARSPIESLFLPLRCESATQCGAFSAADVMIHGYARGPEPDAELYWDVRVMFDAMLTDWALPWTFYESIAAIGIGAAKDVAFPPLTYSPSINEYERPGVAFDLELPEDDYPFGRFLTDLEQRLETIFRDSAPILNGLRERQRVSAAFEFPEPIRAACEQYLVYFGQFLRDLGIDATTELKEQAGAVLFHVTPSEGVDALQRIREALDVYLNLPSSPGFADAERSSDVAVQQLVANVFHLKSQLALSQAIIQAKDAAIQSYQITNSQLLQRIPQISSGEKGAAEPIIGEFVSVTKYDEHGVQVNFADIVRSLKRRLRRSK